MELASKYNPADVEGKWYQYWLDCTYLLIPYCFMYMIMYIQK